MVLEEWKIWRGKERDILQVAAEMENIRIWNFILVQKELVWLNYHIQLIWRYIYIYPIANQKRATNTCKIQEMGDIYLERGEKEKEKEKPNITSVILVPRIQ